MNSLATQPSSKLMQFMPFLCNYIVLFEQVQKIQGELATVLSLDGTLLAQLRQRQLLTEQEMGDINAHILGHNQPAAGTYFVNSVLNRWSIMFESNVNQLIEALQSHDDSGNQNAAKKLRLAISECEPDMHAPMS